MSEEQEITKSGGAIAGLTMISRVLGVVRDMVASNAFGANYIADAYYVAFSIPNMLRKLAGEGSLTISFIPVFTGELEKKGKEQAMKLAYSTFWVTLILLGLITALGMIFSPQITSLLAPGFGNVAGKMELATRMTFEMFPYTIMICMVALCMGILNSFRHFAAPAASQILLNIASILAILLINNRYHFWHPGVALVVGVLVGGALQFLIQVPPLLKHGFRFKLYLDLRHPGLRQIGKIMLPSLFAASIYQLNVFINTIFVSRFPGGRSWIYYADRFIELPLAIFGIAIATAILPNLSSYAARSELDRFRELLGFGLRLVAFLIIPSMLGLIFLRVPIVSLIYQHGEFQSSDTLQTAFAVLFYALALWASAGARIMTQSFYALKDARIPAICAAVGMILNLIGCATLTRIPRLGFAGVALSTSLATMLNFLLLFVIFTTRRVRMDFSHLGATIFRCLLASIPMVALAAYVSRLGIWLQAGHTLDKILWVSAAVLGGAGMYFGIARLLKMSELEPLLGLLGRKPHA